MARPLDLDRILRALDSDEKKVREGAGGDLFKFRQAAQGLPLAEGLKALRAASKHHPFESPCPYEVAEDLVAIAARQPRVEYAPVIEELFHTFSDGAKREALFILADLEEGEAAVAYMNLVRQHAKAGRIPKLVTGPLEQRPRHVDIFFPDLMQYATVSSFVADIYRLCLAYCEAGLLSAKVLSPFTDQVVRSYELLAEKLQPAQRSTGVAWMWEEPYSTWRFEAGVLLDLLGYFGAPAVETELCRALDYRDPRLKHFAIVSLLRLNKPVDEKHVADVAADSEMRNWLYNHLQGYGRLSLYPEKYRTQAAFAECDMVQWLTYPTELARAPDAIELMKVIPVDTGLPGGVYDYFLFRFRTKEPHWAAKDGWIAGVSGPFRRDDQPTTVALGETFSTFTKWNSQNPDDHIGDVGDLIKRWREYHAKRHN